MIANAAPDKNIIKILALGDVVGQGALDLVCACLPRLRARFGADLVIVNGENASLGHGNGITADQARSLVFAGADVITTGNHAFAQRSLYDLLDESDRILRPANYPPSCPGHGFTTVECAGRRVLVANVSGRVNMNENALLSPFDVSDALLSSQKGRYDISIIDFHAEATSEKYCFAAYLDGRVNAVFGTHTHVATADARILALGCAFVTDIGMCGPRDSAIGVDEKIITALLRTGMPQRFRVSDSKIYLSGAVFSFTQDCRALPPQSFSLSAEEAKG